MIYEITPDAADKRYGALLNEQISHFPKDCWIVIRDADTMYLQTDRGRIMREAIAERPDTDLFTCATNRAWGQGLSQQTDIMRIWEVAQNRKKAYIEMRGVMPAFFWMFRRSLWEANPFDEYPIIHNGTSFDARWTNRDWKKVRIDHLYVFHFYRLNKFHRDYEHLK